jgi:hypothetical protein
MSPTRGVRCREARVDQGTRMRQLLIAALIVAGLALPDTAQAGTDSTAMNTAAHTVHGVITSIHGKYGLMVRDDRADDASVTMHRGTIINPKGLQLLPGMQVMITGHLDGHTFDADKIDAPAQYLVDQKLARRAQEGGAPSGSLVLPNGIPNGTFQTNGPSAEGGG